MLITSSWADLPDPPEQRVSSYRSQHAGGDELTLSKPPEIMVDPRPIQRILVPIDGSPVSASVLDYVSGMALHLKAAVVLLTCVPPGLKSGVPERDRLEELAKPLRKRGLDVKTVVHQGEAGTGIVEASQRYEADLIAMTARAKQGGKTDMLGSTAHEVLRSRVEPVLVLAPPDGKVAAREWSKPDAIVVGLDGSALATTALPHAELLAKAFNSEIVLVRAVMPPDALGGAARYYGAVDDFAERYVAGIVESMRRRGLRVSARTGHRSADRELVAAADSFDSALIVLSTRGLTGRPDLVLGSVTDKVVRAQRHPVLAVPAARPRPA